MLYAPWNSFLANIATKDKLDAWLKCLPSQLEEFLNSKEGDEFKKYIKVLERTASISSSSYDFCTDYVTVGKEDEISPRQAEMLNNLFKEYMPWRKGPFKFFGQTIESEWRSFKKWDRLLEFITPLKDRTILDVGCGNGYHMWRMMGEGAKQVIGIDPCALFVAQFELLKRSFNNNIKDNITLLPLGIEQLPALQAFDTVFSMGVLYHRRSPIDHLYQLQAQLKPKGELVLETLVVDGDENTVLIPKDRYAKMPNVWYIPSTKALENLLKRCGFVDVQVVSVEMTTTEEQRKTELMITESLEDFLDPTDPTKTIEGYQAPTRAVFIAHKKG